MTEKTPFSFDVAQREVRRLTEHLNNAAALSPEEEAGYRVDRALIFTSLGMNLRKRPAQESERVALSGPDPLQYAQLSLQDCNRAITLTGKNLAVLRAMGDAHLLLESYRQARDSFLEGLSFAYDDKQCLSGLSAANEYCKEVEEGRKQQRSVKRTDDFECALCFKLFFLPCTTSCGHTFCKGCLLRASDYSSKCPTCRKGLLIHGGFVCTNITLEKIIEASFKEEYEERRKEEALRYEAGGRCRIPLFIMTAMIPGQRMALNIFEPRYRLMIRRAMAGSRRFGMLGIDREHTVDSVGCECEITECNSLPDGRFQIEMVGRRRFFVHSTSEEDGYRTAEAEFFRDDPISEEEKEEVTRTAARLIVSTEKALHVVQERCNASFHREIDVQQHLAPRPSPDDVFYYEDLGFWAAAELHNPFWSWIAADDVLISLPLTCRNTLRRLQVVIQAMEAMCAVHDEMRNS